MTRSSFVDPYAAAVNASDIAQTLVQLGFSGKKPVISCSLLPQFCRYGVTPYTDGSILLYDKWQEGEYTDYSPTLLYDALVNILYTRGRDLASVLLILTDIEIKEIPYRVLCSKVADKEFRNAFKQQPTA